MKTQEPEATAAEPAPLMSTPAIFAQIEARRVDLESIVEMATATIEEQRARIRDARAELASLPRPPIKRAKKAASGSEVE